jgi:hypothetical protein
VDLKRGRETAHSNVHDWTPPQGLRVPLQTQLTKVRDAYDYARDERDEVLAWITTHQDAVEDSKINRLLDEADAAVRDIPDEYV